MSLAQPKLLKIANRLGRVLDLGGSHRPGWRHCFTEAARLSQKLCASLPFGPKLGIRERRDLFSELNLIHLELLGSPLALIDSSSILNI
jgi:hypothetical protein